MAKLRVKRGEPDARGRRPIKGYSAEFYDAQQRPAQVRLSLKTKDEQAARLAIAKLERAYAAGEFDPWAGDRRVDTVAGRSATVAAAIDEYVASRKGDLAASSIKTDGYVLGRLEKALPPGLLVGHVHRDHIEHFLSLGR